MDPILGGLITGGASLLGNMFSANTSASNTAAQIAAQQNMLNETEQFNASQAEINRNFQNAELMQTEGYNQTMASTAYQRAVGDMTKAGLNPAMMFGSGGASSVPAASAPGGSTASVGTPGVPMPQTQSPFANLGDVAAKAVSSAVGVKTFEKMTEEIANLQADAAYTKAKTVSEWQQPGLIDAQKVKVDAERRLREAELPPAQLEASTARGVMGAFDQPGGVPQSSLPSWLKETTDAAGYMFKQLNPFLSSAKAIGGF